MLHLLTQSAFLAQFASAGGGGSSSGGGGDGIIALLGYVPMHFVGAFLRRFCAKRQISFVIAQGVGWVVAFVYAAPWAFLMGAGGKWVAGVALLGMAGGLYNLFDKLKQKRHIKKSIQLAAASDPAWDNDALLEMMRRVFMRYQRDWTNHDVEGMRSYMTERYHRHASLLVAAMHELRRKNVVDDIHIDEIMVVDMVDADGVGNDIVTIGVKVRARDVLIDERSGNELFSAHGDTIEFWRFVRDNQRWLLDGIQPATAVAWVHDPYLESFATNNGMYFSLDMGRLLIPSDGQLFGKTKFRTADINNHIVGLYREQYLIQLYTYSPQPKANSTNTYFIAQMSVPRDYGRILVRRKSVFGWATRPRGLEQVSMEWGMFNEKYEVYASSYEAATSFELLNPTFMEKLEALPFAISIEVVDNSVYLFTGERKAPREEYVTMLGIVYEAYAEMRM